MSWKILQFVLILDAKKCWTVFVYMECEFRLSFIPEHIDDVYFCFCLFASLNEARKEEEELWCEANQGIIRSSFLNILYIGYCSW